MESNRLISRFRNSIASQSIRRGLTLAIPFLIMGSFSLLFTNFPNDSYQIFIKKCLDGSVIALLDTLYEISLGSLALILCVTISLSYGLLAERDTFLLYPVVSVCSYLAFCGGLEAHEDYIFNAEWVFTAMCITLLSCILFRRALKLSSRFDRLHTTGAEYLFNLSIQSLLPVILNLVFLLSQGTGCALSGGAATSLISVLIFSSKYLTTPAIIYWESCFM